MSVRPPVLCVFVISAKLFFDSLASLCYDSHLDEYIPKKSIIKSINLLGQNTNSCNLVIKIYNDGSVKKEFSH